MTGHTYRIETEESALDGATLYRFACTCGDQGRGWLDMYSADDEAGLHGARHESAVKFDLEVRQYGTTAWQPGGTADTYAAVDAAARGEYFQHDWRIFRTEGDHPRELVATREYLPTRRTANPRGVNP